MEESSTTENARPPPIFTIGTSVEDGYLFLQQDLDEVLLRQQNQDRLRIVSLAQDFN